MRVQRGPGRWKERFQIRAQKLVCGSLGAGGRSPICQQGNLSAPPSRLLQNPPAPHTCSATAQTLAPCASASASTGTLLVSTPSGVYSRGLSGIPPKPTSTCQNLTLLANKIFMGVALKQLELLSHRSRLFGPLGTEGVAEDGLLEVFQSIGGRFWIVCLAHSSPRG